MILAAGRATLQMGAQAGYRGVGVGAGQLGLHVAVELFEALLAGQLGPGGAQQAPKQAFALGVGAHAAPLSLPEPICSPCSDRLARSRRRASWSVL